MERFVNIGFGNVVNVSKVCAVVKPEAAPMILQIPERLYPVIMERTIRSQHSGDRKIRLQSMQRLQDQD